MTWAITYRTTDPAHGAAAEMTETLTDEWCRSAGVQPFQVADRDGAIWTLALLVGSQGGEDAELIRVQEVP